MSTALLLVESEASIRASLERHLTADGFTVVGVEAGVEALDRAERDRPDLLLLGMVFPDASGLELCRRLREGEPGRSWDRDVPVIVLGQDEADAVDRVRAFARGCDDFLPRPFVYDELVARIRAVLRRTTPPPRERLEAGGIVIDRSTRQVVADGERVVLSAKEYELLLRLAGDPRHVFGKQELLREVWGFRSPGRTRTLDSHASRLRRKLRAVSDTPYVVNVWGVGYRLLE